jgi:hypothetical protein
LHASISWGVGGLLGVLQDTRLVIKYW